MNKKRAAAIILLILQIVAAVIGDACTLQAYNALTSGSEETVGGIFLIAFSVIIYVVQLILFGIGTGLNVSLLAKKDERTALDWVILVINSLLLASSLSIFAAFLLAGG